MEGQRRTMSSGEEEDLGEVGGWRPVTTEAVTDYAGEQVEIIISLCTRL